MIMTDEEAVEKAMEELGHRATQMTDVEFQEVVADRARELAGRPKLARLSSGRRLSTPEQMQLYVGIDALLSDFYNTATFGDARRAGRDVIVLFRLSARQDVSYTVTVDTGTTDAVDFREVGRLAALRVYDALTPERVVRLLAAKPAE